MDINRKEFIDYFYKNGKTRNRNRYRKILETNLYKSKQ